MYSRYRYLVLKCSGDLCGRVNCVICVVFCLIGSVHKFDLRPVPNWTPKQWRSVDSDQCSWQDVYVFCARFARMWGIPTHAVKVSFTREQAVVFWHSGDRASWYILIIKANEMHNFSNLFDKVLYMFWTGPLSIIRSISTLYTRNSVC